MDVVEFAEALVGYNLPEWQKAFIRDVYKVYKDRKDVRIVMCPVNGRSEFYTYLKQNNLPINKELKELTQDGKTLDCNN